jgi:hypothetical protein
MRFLQTILSASQKGRAREEFFTVTRRVSLFAPIEMS